MPAARTVGARRGPQPPHSDSVPPLDRFILTVAVLLAAAMLAVVGGLAWAGVAPGVWAFAGGVLAATGVGLVWALRRALRPLQAAQRALAEERDLLRAVIDALPGGVALKTLDGRMLLVNEYTARRLGHAPAAMEGQPSARLAGAAFLERMAALDSQLVAQGGGQVVSIMSPSDELDDIKLHMVIKTLLRMPGRAEPLILTATADVTELQRSRQALAAAEQMLRSVFDADDAQLFLKDEQGRFVMVNAAVLRYWGLTAEQVIGHTSYDIFGDQPSVRVSLELDRRVWEGGSAVDVEQRIHGRDKSGDFVITRRLVTASDGRRLLLGLARDVSTLRDQARRLEHQERLIREVIDLEDHFILVKDAQLRYVLVNATYAKATGKRMDEIIGRTLDEAFGSDDVRATITSIDQRVLDERVTIVREETLEVRKGGGPRRYLADRRPIVLADGSVGVLAVVRDVTEEREREASLRAAMQRAQAAVEARSRFLANISHEVRTPINGMMGLTDLVLASPLAPQQREWLTLARGSAQGLLEILNDVLDLSKIEAGAMGLEHTAFDLHALLVEACRPMALRAHSKALAFSVVIAPELPESTMGDPTRLRQVIGNLVGNAVKFTQAGAVTVRAGVRDGADGRHYRVAVEDTGPGIAQEKQEQVFEPFVQADESTTRRFGGTGLGLAICRQLVSLMGGRIALDSSPGRGSRFTVELPLETVAVPPLPSLPGRCVAWIEGQGGEYEAWQPWLARWGVGATVVSHPAQAIALRHDAVDTIVFDGVREPEAYDAALREWRGHGELRRLIVLQPVGAVDSAIQRPAALLPAARGLPVIRLARPLSPRELHEALTQKLEGRRGAPASGAARLGRRLAGCRVLLAEDNEVNLLVAQTVLASLGADEVVSVRDGALALEQLLKQRFDVVMMDIQMPEVDGTDVVRQWRTLEAERGLERTPVVAMTAHAMSGDRERFIAGGFDGYVGKPFTPRALADEVDRVLGTPVPSADED